MCVQRDQMLSIFCWKHIPGRFSELRIKFVWSSLEPPLVYGDSVGVLWGSAFFDVYSLMG